MALPAGGGENMPEAPLQQSEEWGRGNQSLGLQP